MLLALVLAAGTVFSRHASDGFIPNRQLVTGLVAALFLAFIAKLYFRTLEDCRREREEEQRELAGTTGNGPPSFNG